MKYFALLFILSLALAQTSCGNSDVDNYVLVTLEVTGSLIGYPSDDETVTITPLYMDPSDSSTLAITTLCGTPVTNPEDFLVGGCEQDFIYTAKQIKDGEAHIDMCLLADSQGGGIHYNYQFQSESSVVRGFCVKVKNTLNNHYYTGVCYQSAAKNTQSFGISELPDNKIYTPSINRITDTIFVDAFNAAEIRPEIALILNHDTPIDAGAYGNYLTQLTFEGETTIGLQFKNDDYIFSGQVISSNFDTTTSFTIRTGPEDEPKKIVNIKKFDCSTSGEYPVLVTRVHNGNTNSEVFSLKNSQGELIGDTINVNDESPTSWGSILKNSGSDIKGLIAEHAVCLPKDDYTLEMYVLSRNNMRLSISWTSDSYVTFSTLSEQRSDEIKYTGYIVGDFAFTSSTGSTSNILTIHLGPVECANNQRVVVFDKLATTNGGTEGFEVFKRNSITGEYPEEPITQYYGLANFLGGRFDPYFRVFLCLDKSTYRIRLRNKQRVNVACTAWSTTSS
ncbi:hypothetical protein WA158_006783 [Blastocystis sp. Blastoise]